LGPLRQGGELFVRGDGDGGQEGQVADGGVPVSELERGVQGVASGRQVTVEGDGGVPCVAGDPSGTLGIGVGDGLASDGGDEEASSAGVRAGGGERTGAGGDSPVAGRPGGLAGVFPGGVGAVAQVLRGSSRARGGGGPAPLVRQGRE
jgi:hypothetical protein